MLDAIKVQNNRYLTKRINPTLLYCIYQFYTLNTWQI